MDFGSGLWIKEALHSVPKESKPLACIDNEHAAQGLKKQINISYIVYMMSWPTEFSMVGRYLRVVVTIDFLNTTYEFPRNFVELSQTLSIKQQHTFMENKSLSW